MLIAEKNVEPTCAVCCGRKRGEIVTIPIAIKPPNTIRESHTKLQVACFRQKENKE